tara:strand:- start:50 stop:229 length:180 start_codon:yes stop_codon:yes gene_type:complete
MSNKRYTGEFEAFKQATEQSYSVVAQSGSVCRSLSLNAARATNYYREPCFSSASRTNAS